MSIMRTDNILNNNFVISAQLPMDSIKDLEATIAELRATNKRLEEWISYGKYSAK